MHYNFTNQLLQKQLATPIHAHYFGDEKIGYTCTYCPYICLDVAITAIMNSRPRHIVCRSWWMHAGVPKSLLQSHRQWWGKPKDMAAIRRGLREYGRRSRKHIRSHSLQSHSECNTRDKTASQYAPDAGNEIRRICKYPLLICHSHDYNCFLLTLYAANHIVAAETWYYDVTYDLILTKGNSWKLN